MLTKKSRQARLTIKFCKADFVYYNIFLVFWFFTNLVLTKKSRQA